MNILLLCDRYPDSYRDGLLLRVLHLVRQLRGQHRVDLMCTHAGETALGEPADLFTRIWIVPPAGRRPRTGWRGLFTAWDPRRLYADSPELRQLLDAVVDPSEYDVVWDAGASMLLHLPPRWASVPVVADLVDDMVLTYSRAIENTPWSIQKLRLMKYRELHRRFECDCMRRAAVCCVVSDDDAHWFARASPRVPVRVVQNGVDVDHFIPGTLPVVPGQVVFEGSMSFPPNLAAALFLVKDVMPRVWLARPDATVVLVGRDPPPELQALAGPRVVVTGSVDDVRPYVQQAEVFVCPLRSGAGIKNKLLQAWAMGKAIVATPVSLGGLGARDGVDLLVRDGAEALAVAVLQLFADAPLRERLGRAGRATTCERFTWQAQALAFEGLLVEAARTATRTDR